MRASTKFTIGLLTWLAGGVMFAPWLSADSPLWWLIAPPVAVLLLIVAGALAMGLASVLLVAAGFSRPPR